MEIASEQITQDLINQINQINQINHMNIPGILATSAQLQEQKKQKNEAPYDLISGGYQGQNWNGNGINSKDLYNDFVKGMRTPARTNPLEEIINIMFSQEEKQQILIDAGWEFYKGNSGSDMMRSTEGEFVTGLHFGYAFLQVITNKFKNLLLLKPTIKVKL